MEPQEQNHDHDHDHDQRQDHPAVGTEMVGKLTYYERWIVAFANILFRKGILTPTELALKMEEVEARWPDERADNKVAPTRA